MKRLEHIDSGGWRLGRLLVTPYRLHADSPFMDGSNTTLERRATPDATTSTRVRYGGLALNFLPWPGRRNHSVVVSWLGAGVPNPARWRPRFVLGQLVWRAKGRPPSPVGRLHDGQSFSDYLVDDPGPRY